MKYKLATSRIKPIELFLFALIIIVINYFFWGHFTGLFLLANVGVVILFFYRLYGYLFIQYPVELETSDDAIIFTYDRGLKRSLSYSYVKYVKAEYNENKDNYRLVIYLKKSLKKPKNKVSANILVDEKDAQKIIDDIAKRSNLN